MFQLSQTEKGEVVTVCDHLTKLKFSKTLPYAFTEHGALMVATVLNTQCAVEISLYSARVRKTARVARVKQGIGGEAQRVGPHAPFVRTLRVKNADAAMYQAKALGRNNYQFFGQM